MVKAVCANFDKIIVLLNTGAMIDTSWFVNDEKISSNRICCIIKSIIHRCNIGSIKIAQI